MKQFLKKMIKNSYVYQRIMSHCAEKLKQDNQYQTSSDMGILSAYVIKEPTDQNILDIFDGQWSSSLPEKFGLITKPGTAELFEDARIVWTEECFGSFDHWDILELGPLEGGHSFMFQNRGVNKVVAIEANSNAFLKCLCIKELLDLDRVSFKLGDFISFLKNDPSRYDMVFASGVLYHMENPVELLDLISKVTDKVFIWTHYYDEQILSQREDLFHKFEIATTLDYKGFSYQASTQFYKTALEWQGFCGGSRPMSKWLTRDSLIEALKHFGFTEIHQGFEHEDHINGPAMAICARK